MVKYSKPEIKEWLKDIYIKKGRPLRILHVGNIANNAFQNAVIMRRLGIDCDVLCHDYYHIMACPEWEEANFKGIIKNQFHPDWTSVDTAGYVRPDWFVQGPFDLCVKYLIAKCNGNLTLMKDHWKWLGYYNKTRKLRTLDVPELQIRYFIYFVKRWFYALTDPDRVDRKLNEILGQSKARYELFWKINKWTVPLIINLSHFLSLLFLKIRKVTGLSIIDEEFKELRTRLISDYQKSFPRKKNKLNEYDLYMYKPVLFYLRNIFTHYDLVIAYGTDPIYPLIANVPFFAIEHGTLREIPHQENSIGRLTALSYHKAQCIFVTNIDCFKSAQELGAERVKIIPHPYDDKTSKARAKYSKSIREQLKSEIQSDILLFHPTRQDWMEGSGYADKGNDLFFRAFARLREESHSVGVICCEWGGNVFQSKQLIEKLGCSKYVKWKQPMGAVEYEQVILSIDVVIDQFKLGAFGGVLFRSLTLGKPVCTYLNEALVLETYKVMPPVINCSSEDDIYESLCDIFSNKKKLEQMGELGKEWIGRHHNGDMTAIIQLQTIKSTGIKFVGKRKDTSFIQDEC